MVRKFSIIGSIMKMFSRERDEREDEIIDIGEIGGEDVLRFEMAEEALMAVDEDVTEVREARGGEGDVEIQGVMRIPSKLLDVTEKLKEIEPKIAKVESRVSDVDTKVKQMDTSIAIVKKSSEETKEKIEKVEKTTQKLLSVYELITNKINPFLEKEKTSPGEDVVEPIMDEVEKVHEEVEEKEEVSLPKSERQRIYELWLKYMSKKVGIVGIASVLDHYERTGWIGEDIKNEAMAQLKVIDFKDTPEKMEGEMKGKDHMTSHFFISKLKSNEVDANLETIIMEELKELGLLEKDR